MYIYRLLKKLSNETELLFKITEKYLFTDVCIMQKKKNPISILPIIHNTCKPMTNMFIQINSNTKIQYK